MWSRIKANRHKAIILFFLGILSLISIINIPPSYEEQAQMINTMPPLVKLEVNLGAILQYNKPERSIVYDIKDLFKRDLSSSSKIYNMHKLNILSVLVMILLPVLMVITALVALNTSINAMLLIITIFFCFTILPMLVL